MPHRNLSPREELLHIQRTFYQKIRSEIADYVGHTTSYFEQYRERYEQDLQTYKRASSKAELIQNVLTADIVYCGDYHTLRQSQRTVIRILREVLRHDQEVILAVEVVHNEHQEILNNYMLGQLSDKEFLAAVDYRNTWNFDWSNYKMIFDFARKYGLKVYGINCQICRGERILTKRDRVATDLVVDLKLQYPDQLLFVLYGDLHIGTEHIPGLVQQRWHRIHSDTTLRDVIVYQNSEHLYWTLAEKGLEQSVDVLKLDDRRFCVMNTPPWIKLQTYLNWLEHNNWLEADSEEDLYDFGDSTDYHDRLMNMAQTIATFLGLPDQNFSDFHVYTSGDVSFLDFLNTYLKEQSHTNPVISKMIESEIIHNGTCLLQDEQVIYLTTISINKASEKIAQFVHYQVSDSVLFYEKACDKRQYYFGRVLFEAIGYIGSKIINYKRKCELINDYHNLMASLKGKRLNGRLADLRKIARFTVRHFQLGNDTLKTGKLQRGWHYLAKQPPDVIYGLTAAVGRILGDYLYSAVMNNDLAKVELQRLFSRPISADSDNMETYLRLTRMLGPFHSHKHSKSDRF